MEFFKEAGQLFIQGGLVMWPLLICSIISVAILIERVRTYNAATSDMETLKAKVAELVPQGKWEELRQVCKNDGGVAAELVEALHLNRMVLKNKRKHYKVQLVPLQLVCVLT